LNGQVAKQSANKTTQTTSSSSTTTTSVPGQSNTNTTTLITSRTLTSTSTRTTTTSSTTTSVPVATTTSRKSITTTKTSTSISTTSTSTSTSSTTSSTTTTSIQEAILEWCDFYVKYYPDDQWFDFSYIKNGAIVAIPVELRPSEQGFFEIAPYIANYGTISVADVLVNLSITTCSAWDIPSENITVDWIYNNGQCMQLDFFVPVWNGEVIPSGTECTFVFTENYSNKTFTFTVVFE